MSKPIKFAITNFIIALFAFSSGYVFFDLGKATIIKDRLLTTSAEMKYLNQLLETNEIEKASNTIDQMIYVRSLTISKTSSKHQ